MPSSNQKHTCVFPPFHFLPWDPKNLLHTGPLIKRARRSEFKGTVWCATRPVSSGCICSPCLLTTWACCLVTVYWKWSLSWLLLCLFLSSRTGGPLLSRCVTRQNAAFTLLIRIRRDRGIINDLTMQTEVWPCSSLCNLCTGKYGNMIFK